MPRSVVVKRPIVIDSDDCDVIEIKKIKGLDLDKNLERKRPNAFLDSDTDDDIIEIKENKKPDSSKDSSSDFIVEIDEDSCDIKCEKPWTVKYRPLSSGDVLDNEEASSKIKEWIDDFIKPDNKFYEDDFEGNCLESCVLIYGPTGCGKTALVYALAEELNYKVFEINCSSRRNGKIINQIKEATLSHIVTRKSTSNQNIIKAPKPKINKKSNSKQKTLFSFFKKKTVEQEVVRSPLIDESSLSQETFKNLKALSISSNSLILIDDVDIIFEEDSGFWQALQLLIESTKRPIILTATSSIKSIKQEIKGALCVEMNYPARERLETYLENILLKECYSDKQIEILADHIEAIKLNVKDHHCDIRSCLNRLQFDFSSINVLKSDESILPNLSNNHVNLNEESSDFNAKNYNNLIYSDLLSSNFQVYRRNEMDNACFVDENYQVKNLKESILVEFKRLNKHQSDLFENDSLDDYRLVRTNWSSNFQECKLELDKYLEHLAPKENLFCDYIPYLSTIMNLEQERLQLYLEHTRRARRFLLYLDGLNFHLSDNVKQFLTENYLSHRL